jgi:hypothetical protein
MKPECWLPAFLLCMSAILGAQQVSSDHPGVHARFAASNGAVIELDTRTGTLDAPRSRGTRLEDCSDKSQVCITDHHGFAFSYFRKCNDAGFGNYKSLRFPPKVASVLHNDHVWLVFDASPNYLFHYSYSKGIVGIYVGPTASYDFRHVFHDRKVDWTGFDEYRTTGPDIVAACSQ